MPTIEQIRAARALLGWSQDDLAHHAGLSQTGIARIENGTNKPNSSTLEKINTAFDAADVEFINTSGVKKRENKVKIYKGHEGFVAFLDDVYRTLKSQPGEQIVVVNNVKEDEFLKWEGTFSEVHEKRMENLGIRYHIVVQEGDENFTASAYAEYRWVSPDIFSHISYYIYADRAALINFEENNVTVYVIYSGAVADFYRHEFQKVWKRARKVID